MAERVDLLIFLTVHVEGGAEISARDRKIFDRYRPSFKQIQQLQDVQLHFEIPTEYAPAEPMFSEPVDRIPVEADVPEYSPEPAKRSEILLKTPRPQANRPASISAIKPASKTTVTTQGHFAQNSATDPM